MCTVPVRGKGAVRRLEASLWGAVCSGLLHPHATGAAGSLCQIRGALNCTGLSLFVVCFFTSTPGRSKGQAVFRLSYVLVVTSSNPSGDNFFVSRV